MFDCLIIIELKCDPLTASKKSGDGILDSELRLAIYFFQQKGIEIWARPILPVYRGKYSYAIVFLNRRTDGTPSEVIILRQ